MTKIFSVLAMVFVFTTPLFADDYLGIRTGNKDQVLYRIDRRETQLVSALSLTDPLQLIEQITMSLTETKGPYTILRNFTLQVSSRPSQKPGAAPGSREIIIEGKTPEGALKTAGLEPQLHTLEVKPEGTLLARYCGANELKGSLITEVCLLSAKPTSLEETAR